MPSSEYRFDAIGVPWRVDTNHPLTPETRRAVHDRIEAFDRVYSRFRGDSLVSRMAREAGTWRLPADAAPLLSLYRTLYERSAGAVTPLVGHSLEALGYDREYSLRPSATRVRVPSWEEAIEWDGERLTTLHPVLLDVGAAGKGYLVDLVAEVLQGSGVTEYVIDASGDLLHRGDEPLRVALEHPGDAGKAIGVYRLANRALCASAPNRRSWGAGLHHILDPLSGEPSSGVAAAWAISETTLVADGLATGLFFAGADAFAGDYDFQYVRMMPGGRVEYSPNLDGELFT